MNGMQTDDETNLVTSVAQSVTVVPLKTKAEPVISVSKMEGSGVPSKLTSKNTLRLTRRDARNRIRAERKPPWSHLVAKLTIAPVAK
jgi:hypothetical protein